MRDDVRRRLGGLRRRLAPQLGLAPQLRARALPGRCGLVRAAAPLFDVDVINAPVWKSKFYGAFASTSTPSTRRLLDFHTATRAPQCSAASSAR